MYEHTSGSEDNASENRSLSGPQVTSIRAQQDTDHSRHDLSPCPDLKSVAPGVNPEPEIGNARGLAEDSDSVPESTTINHLATNDITPVIKQVRPVLPRGFSAIEWNGCWVVRRGSDINITQACLAVGLKKSSRRTRIAETVGYYQLVNGTYGMYVPPDCAREVLGSAGADLMRQLCPMEEQPVAKKTRTHLSNAQRATLEATYQRNPKLKRTERAEIAKELGVEKDCIRVSPSSKAPFPYMLTGAAL